MMLSSLQKRAHELAQVSKQIDLLDRNDGIVRFESKLKESNLLPLKTTSLDTMQINLGKMCNQVCKHCHVDAGPDRKEIMTNDVMQLCLDALKDSPIQIVDLTGGAPEMNPNFRWFVEELSALKKHIIVRCNLTIILANKKHYDLPEFFKLHKVEIASSLPYFTAIRTDAQRGNGVFEQSIEALKMLNTVGYGINPNLQLNLVYNPTGSFLPGDQSGLEREFKTKLKDKYDIVFNQLFAITNLPVSRFLEHLVNLGKYEEYMQTLVEAYNPIAAEGVMCRNMVSVSWDGFLYDCDFNQMLDLKIQSNSHIQDFDFNKHIDRNIIVKKHCFGCTAGAGSSCGGSTS
jgi:radical SAM/Cys-rich protein